MALQFDNKISTGHVLTIIGMTVAGIIAFKNLEAGQERLAQEQARIVADLVVVTRTGDAREARIRSVEIAQASQSSDLRSIQIGISRIEAQLERLQPKP